MCYEEKRKEVFVRDALGRSGARGRSVPVERINVSWPQLFQGGLNNKWRKDETALRRIEQGVKG